MSDVFKALSDPTRRRVLELLRDGPMSAGDLADQFVLSKPTMSGHFAVLRDADLIQADKVGTTITYRLNTSVLEDALLTFVRTFGFSVQSKAETTDAARGKDRRRDSRGNARGRRLGVVRRP